MRVLYLHQYFNTPDMPGGTRSYEFARRLVARGHQVTLLTTDRTASRGGWRLTREDGIDVHWLPIPYSNKAGYGQRIWAFLKFAVRSSLHAISLPTDVVYATSTPLTIAIPGVLASRFHRVPLVFEVRDLWPELPIAVGALRNPFSIAIARWLERWAYRNSVRVVALSPGMREGVIRAGYPEDRVTVIPNSSDLQLFDVDPSRGLRFRQSHSWLQERPLVVYTGTLGRINGVSYLVRLTEKVRSRLPGARFLVVGEGQEFEKIESLARELKILEESFFMMRSVPKERIPDILSAATLATSLFLNIPEMWANSANKFFDALAAGRPVAVNYGGWQADLLRESGAGVVLDPVDIDLAANTLSRALLNPQATEEMGVKARQLAEERFSRDMLAEEMHKVLALATRERCG